MRQFPDPDLERGSALNQFCGFLTGTGKAQSMAKIASWDLYLFCGFFAFGSAYMRESCGPGEGNQPNPA